MADRALLAGNPRFTIISKLFFAPAGDTILCITKEFAWPASGAQQLSTHYKEHRGSNNCFNFPWELSLFVSRTKRVACDTFMAPRAMVLMLICNTLLEIVTTFVNRLRLWKAVEGLQFLYYFRLSWFNTLQAGKYIHFANDILKFIFIKHLHFGHAFL